MRNGHYFCPSGGRELESNSVGSYIKENYEDIEIGVWEMKDGEGSPAHKIISGQGKGKKDKNENTKEYKDGGKYAQPF